MADGGSTANNGLLYGLVGALCVVVAGGGYYIYDHERTASAPLAQAAAPAPVPPPAPVAKPAPVATPAPVAPPVAAPAGPSASQLAQARAAIAEAQRLAGRGDFTGAETSLQNADRLVPGFAETATARREIAEQRTTRGDGRRDRGDQRQDNNRLAALVDTARAAIARRDYGAADRALDEAERIDARDPQVVRTRSQLQEAAARPNRPDRN